MIYITAFNWNKLKMQWKIHIFMEQKHIAKNKMHRFFCGAASENVVKIWIAEEKKDPYCRVLAFVKERECMCAYEQMEGEIIGATFY